MPVSRPSNRSEILHQRFISDWPYPLESVVPGVNVEVQRVWKTQRYLWIRLSNPQIEASYDFRVVNCYIDGGDAYIAVCPSKRWNHERSLTSINVARVAHPRIVQTLTEDELSELHSLPSVKRDLCNAQGLREQSKPCRPLPEQDQNCAIEQRLRAVFGSLASFDGNIDLQALCLEHQFMIGSQLLESGTELFIDIEYTKSVPGFIKLCYGNSAVVFRVASFLNLNRSTYLGLDYLPETIDGMNKPPMVWIELRSREKAATISSAQLTELGAVFMEAQEDGDAP